MDTELNEKLVERLGVRITHTEREALKLAARKERLPLSLYVRRVLAQACARP